ncbi:ATP-dependent nuclease, subunit A [Lachnospiraceae bacterium KM106-2]|nr:ATP-dependent nuclease, subunit A [Lachnospiraceae bacterium KM106-2]
MSKISWTDDQQKVIDLRKRNILVSAAAGSGKTAVLVERIITMITEGEHPIDIDKLLIVTFTNAAAAEMKERIGKAIEKRLAENPDDGHLQKQMSLLHSAQITTIHSFCLNVIRNNFNSIDLDPSFRIGDEAELQLLQSDVISDLLERKYDEASEDFLKLVECYASGKSDTQLESLITQLYKFSISYPWPMEWLSSKKKSFAIETKEELDQAVWMKDLLDYLKAIMKDVNKQMDQALDLCSSPAGPYFYQPILEQEENYISALVTSNSYEKFEEALENVEWKRLPSKRDANVDTAIRDEVKAIRDGIKKTIKDIKENFFFQPIEEMINDIKGVRGCMDTLIDLTMEYSECYAKEKEDRGIIDFNDLEHFALNILVTREETEDKVTPTLAAVELSEFYEEILIDEYQDSNLVQETILNSISKEKFGQPNVFMVGDVKQSIYKFRMARPELFMHKYNTYPSEDNAYQRIDLHQNFRSRDVVLNPINYIFEQIMTPALGGIEYDEAAALHVGRKFQEPQNEENISKSTELILVGEIEDELLENKSEDYTKKELEAKAVAKRIREIIDPENGLQVVDGDGYRPARLKDIVILFRTMSGWADVFVDVLMQEGIPAFAETQSGYFSTIEIRTILNFLKVIDNPRQEIPLAAILHSPIYQFVSEELAKVKVDKKEYELFDALIKYEKEGDDEVLRGKIEHFLDDLKRYRRMVSYLSIYELIENIIDETGYYQYVLAMPAGEVRAANVDMLIQRAIDFETSSFSGLFDFNRYIEKLEKYDVDFGEAVVSNENDDVVRIMSIHKSKGLEFPVVIVAGMGKSFNNQDARSKLVLHPDLGIGPDFIDDEYRIKSPTLMKKVMAKLVVLENLAEELRVLYVALTRAKEKLIMMGYVDKLQDKIEKWPLSVVERESKTLSYQTLTSASNYLDWVIPASTSHISFVNEIRRCMSALTPDIPFEPLVDDSQEIPLEVHIENVLSIVNESLLSGIRRSLKRDELENWDTKIVHDEDVRAALLSRLGFAYPYVKDQKIHSKVTVTELKRMGQNIDEELSVDLLEEMEKDYEEVEVDLPVPEFVKKSEDIETTIIKATDIGTLYHRVLELMDMHQIQSKDDVIKQVEHLVQMGMISHEESNYLNYSKLYTFASSDVAKRMVAAQDQGRLHREQQFVMGQPANEINKDFMSEEMVLVQGIIDVFFEEEDGLVLLDYKTDRVSSAKQLVKRYKVQLDYYKLALEQVTHKKVKETYIYSFGLGEMISVE